MKSFYRNVTGLLLGAALASGAWAAETDRFAAGYKAFQAGDFRAALENWRPLAAGGEARAQYNLGVMYADGRGVAQNTAEALLIIE